MQMCWVWKLEIDLKTWDFLKWIKHLWWSHVKTGNILICNPIHLRLCEGMNILKYYLKNKCFIFVEKFCCVLLVNKNKNDISLNFWDIDESLKIVTPIWVHHKIICMRYFNSQIYYSSKVKLLVLGVCSTIISF